jgi:N4-gp56 family major capsid protein
MAVTVGAYGSANNVTTTTAANFIPEVWSDEVIAAYKKNLVMANLVRKINHKGKKGDTIHLPAPSRGIASAKAANTVVRIQQDTESVVDLVINRHFEYSRLIEDIVGVQALSSLRRFYTDDAGYALARQMDTDLIQLGRQGNNGTAANAAYATGYIGGDGSTLYVAGSNNASALTDIAVRRMIQRMDDNDLPMEDRYLVIPPSARNTMMGIARYTEQGFVGEVGANNTIRNGRIGNVYGIEVYVTPNCESTTGSTAAKACVLFQKESLALAEQMGVRTQTQYKQEYLGDLFTADCLYGTQILRKGDDADIPTGVFSIIVPA